MCYELWAEDGTLIGVFGDPIRAENALYKNDGSTVTASWPSLNGDTRCVPLSIETKVS